MKQIPARARRNCWGQPVLYFHSAECSIFFAHLSFCTESQEYGVDKCLRQMGSADHVFLLLSWHRIGLDIRRYEQYRAFPCQVILCANSPEEYQELQQAQLCFPWLRYIYFNQNATLDPDLFLKPEPQSRSHEFTMVVNSCFAAFKRTYLSRSVPGAVAHIGYPCRHLPIVLPPFCGPSTSCQSPLAGGGNSSSSSSSSRNSCKSRHFLLNKDGEEDLRYLDHDEVTDAIYKSCLGGIFSEHEGACYASTEYLLCGCPVISTPSVGGRDVWYKTEAEGVEGMPKVFPSGDDGGNASQAKMAPGKVNTEGVLDGSACSDAVVNCIIVPPTEEGVRQGVMTALARPWDRQGIRESALRLRACFWKNLNKEVQRIFDSHGVAQSAEAYAKENSVHKMGL